MKSAKKIVKDILKELPETSSLEDIEYHIYVRKKIERGLEDIRKGRTYAQSDVERWMQKWIAK